MAAQCLEGVKITFSSISQDTLDDLKPKAVQMGAVIISPNSEQDTPHFLIADRVGGKAYRAVLDCNPQAMVLTPDWLSRCWDTQRKVPHAAFQLGPFSGLLVSISGFGNEDRIKLQSAIVAGGGTFTADLYPTCTHLIALRATGKKYLFALRRNMQIVSEKWVEDSADAGYCCNEAMYPAPSSEAVAAADRSTKPVPSASTTSALPPPAPPSFLQRGEDSLPDFCSSLPSVSTATCPSSAIPHPAPQSLASLPTSSPHLPEHPPKLQNPVTLVIEAAKERHGVGQDDDFDFLDQVKAHLCGCSAAETSELLAAFREGAATRYPDLAPALSHIVVGSEVTPAQLASLKEYLGEWRGHTELVRPVWALACAATRQLLPSHPSWSLAPADLNPRAFQALLAQPSASASISTSDAAGGVAVEEGVPAPGPSATEGGGLFQGLWFCLDAVKDTCDEVEAVDLIRLNGGTLFTASTVKLAAGAQLLAVCPHSLPDCVLIPLKQSSPAFNAVARDNYVTLYWLQCCLAARERVDPNRNVTYKPLPHILPLASFQHVVIYVSLYADDQKMACKYLVELLGGAYSAAFTRKVTHLLVPCRNSDREKKTQEEKRFRHIHTVCSSWLTDSASRGVALPPIQFYPSDATDKALGQSQVSQVPPSQPAPTQVKPASKGLSPSSLSLQPPPLLPLSQRTSLLLDRTSSNPSQAPPSSHPHRSHGPQTRLPRPPSTSTSSHPSRAAASRSDLDSLLSPSKSQSTRVPPPAKAHRADPPTLPANPRPSPSSMSNPTPTAHISRSPHSHPAPPTTSPAADSTHQRHLPVVMQQQQQRKEVAGGRDSRTHQAAGPGPASATAAAGAVDAAASGGVGGGPKKEAPMRKMADQVLKMLDTLEPPPPAIATAAAASGQAGVPPDVLEDATNLSRPSSNTPAATTATHPGHPSGRITRSSAGSQAAGWGPPVSSLRSSSGRGSSSQSVQGGSRRGEAGGGLGSKEGGSGNSRSSPLAAAATLKAVTPTTGGAEQGQPGSNQAIRTRGQRAAAAKGGSASLPSSAAEPAPSSLATNSPAPACAPAPPRGAAENPPGEQSTAAGAAAPTPPASASPRAPGSADQDAISHALVDELEHLFKQPFAPAATQLPDPLVLSGAGGTHSSMSDMAGSAQGSGRGSKRSQVQQQSGRRTRQRSGSRAGSPVDDGGLLETQMSQQVGYDTSRQAGERFGGRKGKGKKGQGTEQSKADLIRRVQQTRTNSAHQPDQLQQLGLS